MVFAKIRAHVVFPTPRGPQKRYECASLPLTIALFKVLVSADCPTTERNVDGLYFLAETMKFSMYLFISVAKILIIIKNEEEKNQLL